MGTTLASEHFRETMQPILTTNNRWQWELSSNGAEQCSSSWGHTSNSRDCIPVFGRNSWISQTSFIQSWQLLTGTWVRMVEARSSLASSILVFFGPPPHNLCLLTLFPIYFSAYERTKERFNHITGDHQCRWAVISKEDKAPGYTDCCFVNKVSISWISNKIL